MRSEKRRSRRRMGKRMRRRRRKTRPPVGLAGPPEGSVGTSWELSGDSGASWGPNRSRLVFGGRLEGLTL
eukprot:9241888-Pyramimonas_sp.AAC.1